MQWRCKWLILDAVESEDPSEGADLPPEVRNSADFPPGRSPLLSKWLPLPHLGRSIADHREVAATRGRRQLPSANQVAESQGRIPHFQLSPQTEDLLTETCFIHQPVMLTTLDLKGASLTSGFLASPSPVERSFTARVEEG